MGSITVSDAGEGAAGPSSCFRSGVPKQGERSLSYWLETAQDDPILHHRSTADLPSKADIVVIGSGITGTLIAKHSCETWPDKSIVVLEAREFCSGATGRNAGHCKPDQWRGFDEYRELFGNEQALKILDNEQESWLRLVRYVQEHNVDCDLWIGNTLDVATDKDVAELTHGTFAHFRESGGRVDHIEVTSEATKAKELSRISNAKACYAWSSSTLHPWKLTAHIMKDNLARGVNLYTHTPAVGVVKSPRYATKWLVKTQSGDIECSKIVHATNAYASALEPSLLGLITPTPHICTKFPHAPLSPNGQALQNSYGIVLGGDKLITVNPRSTTNGPILFGGSNPGQDRFEQWMHEHPDRCTDDSLTNFPSVTEAAIEFARQKFIDARLTKEDIDSVWKQSWSGIIGRSADTVPFIGELPDLPDQWICAGYHGHGMARVFTAASGMVKLMAGCDWKATGLPEVFQATSRRAAKLLKDSGLLTKAA